MLKHIMDSIASCNPIYDIKIGLGRSTLNMSFLHCSTLSFSYSGSFCCKLLLTCFSITGFVKDENPYAENGKKGTYFFEFSRPLRTMDHLQQVRS